jgi:hypothetical protein
VENTPKEFLKIIELIKNNKIENEEIANELMTEILTKDNSDKKEKPKTEDLIEIENKDIPEEIELPEKDDLADIEIKKDETIKDENIVPTEEIIVPPTEEAKPQEETKIEENTIPVENVESPIIPPETAEPQEEKKTEENVTPPPTEKVEEPTVPVAPITPPIETTEPQEETKIEENTIPVENAESPTITPETAEPQEKIAEKVEESVAPIVPPTETTEPQDQIEIEPIVTPTVIDVINVDTPLISSDNNLPEAENQNFDFLNNDFLSDDEFVRAENTIQNTVNTANEEVQQTNENINVVVNDFKEETNFAELMPEKEEEEEVKENPFLNKIKGTLINLKERKTDTKDSNVGNENEGPVLDAKKPEDKKEQDKVDEEAASRKGFFASMRERFANRTGSAKTDSSEIGFFDRIVSNVKSVFKKKDSLMGDANDIAIPQNFIKKVEKKPEVKSYKSLLLESEINEALKDTSIDVKFDNTNDEFVETESGNEYLEDGDYSAFLSEREIKQLSERERIIVPIVVPRKKNFVSYEVNRFPEEILSRRRSEINKHIPTLTMSSDIEKMVIGLIDSGDLKNFRALIDKTSNLNQILTSQYALLTYSTQNKKYEIMRYLIFSGADINQKDNKFETALTTAIKNNDTVATKILVDAGANLNDVDVLKRTPLIYAIEKDYEDIAIYLIDNGANIDIRNTRGEKPLNIATRLNRLSVRKRLLDKMNENRRR